MEYKINIEALPLYEGRKVKLVRFGLPKTGDLYVDDLDTITRATMDFIISPCLIVEVEHKEPELIVCFQVPSGGFAEFSSQEGASNFKVCGRIGNPHNTLLWKGEHLDLMLAQLEDDTLWVAAGHWNDGPKN